jgi:transposase
VGHQNVSADRKREPSKHGAQRGVTGEDGTHGRRTPPRAPRSKGRAGARARRLRDRAPTPSGIEPGIIVDIRAELARARSSVDRRGVLRLRAILLRAIGHPTSIVASRVGINVKTVRRWWSSFQAGGVERLKRRSPPGRPARLDDRKKRRVADLLASLAPQAGSTRRSCRGKIVKEFLEEEYGVSYSLGHAYRLRRRLLEEGLAQPG